MIKLLFVCVLLMASLNTSAESAESSDIQRNTNTIRICSADQPDRCESFVLQSNHVVSTALNFFMGGQHEEIRKFEDRRSRDNLRETLISEGFEITHDSNIPSVWYAKAS